jgi:hypothetical protein
MGHSNAVRLRQINVWINNQGYGYLDTFPRDFKDNGLSIGVRLIT